MRARVQREHEKHQHSHYQHNPYGIAGVRSSTIKICYCEVWQKVRMSALVASFKAVLTGSPAVKNILR